MLSLKMLNVIYIFYCQHVKVSNRRDHVAVVFNSAGENLIDYRQNAPILKTCQN